MAWSKTSSTFLSQTSTSSEWVCSNALSSLCNCGTTNSDNASHASMTACAKPQAPASLSALNQVCKVLCLRRFTKTDNHLSKSVCFFGNFQVPGAASSQSVKLMTCGKKAIFGSRPGGRHCSSAALTPIRGPAVLSTTKGRSLVCAAQSQIPLANCSNALASGVMAHECICC